MPISEVIALSSHVEKLGIVGVLVVVCCLLGWATWNYRKELLAVHARLDKLKIAFLVVKQAADGAGVKYDLDAVRDLQELFGEKSF